MKNQRVVVSLLGLDSTVKHDGFGRYEFNGNVLVTVEDLRNYVQVEFLAPLSEGNSYASPRRYTYVDPGLNLKVGDIVDVPTRYNDHNLAVVKSLQDGYDGRAERCVLARYFKESPAVPVLEAIRAQDKAWQSRY